MSVLQTCLETPVLQQGLEIQSCVVPEHSVSKDPARYIEVGYNNSFSTSENIRSRRLPVGKTMKKLALLPLADRSVAREKWHKQVETITIRSLPVCVPADAFSLYPWAQLRAYTDEYLRKRKRLDGEKDGILSELIASHDNMINALAACSHHLSRGVIEKFLEKALRKDHDTGYYFQAFVAASHGNHPYFSSSDEAWAAFLAAISQGLSTETDLVRSLHALLRKWSSSELPVHSTLRSKARDLAISLFCKANTSMTNLTRFKEWDAVAPFAACFVGLDSTSQLVPATLQDTLDWEIPHWRHWSAWKPNMTRIQCWKDCSRDWPISVFWRLLGPDWLGVSDILPTALSRIIAREAFAPWLEKNRMQPSADLLVAEGTPRVALTVERICTVIDRVCSQKDKVGMLFLRHLCSDKELGLGTRALDLWHLANSILSSGTSKFLTAVLTDDIEMTHDVGVIQSALSALQGDAFLDLQDYLRVSIGALFAKIADSWTCVFLKSLQAGDDWMGTAKKLLSFREVISQSSFAASLVTGKLNVMLLSQRPTEHELYTSEKLLLSLCESTSEVQLATKTYIENLVFGTINDEDDDIRLARELHRLWTPSKYADAYHANAVAIASLTAIPKSHRATCIGGTTALSLKKVHKLQSCLEDWTGTTIANKCQRLVRIAAEIIGLYTATDESWQLLVRHVMEAWSLTPEYGTRQRTFTQCSFKKYRSWIANLDKVFGNSLPDVVLAHRWVNRLSSHSNFLEALRQYPKSEYAFHCILTGADEPASTRIIEMLFSVGTVPPGDGELFAVMQHIIASITDHSVHLDSVSHVVSLLPKLPVPDFQLCGELVCISHEDDNIEVAAVQAEVWLRNPLLKPDTRKTLECLVIALQLPPVTRPEVAREYFLRRVAKVMAKTAELETMRFKLKRADPKGISTMLANIHVEESPTSHLEETISGLPDELLNVVEQINDQTVDLHFPLNHFSNLKLLAMGIRQGENMVVRVILDERSCLQNFCVHTIDSQEDWQSLDHMPFNIHGEYLAPNRMLCIGKETRLGYAITRSIWTWCLWHKRVPLCFENIYGMIRDAIISFGRNCIVCDNQHFVDVGLYRPTLCNRDDCKKVWLMSSLELRLADLRLDSAVVELLLAGVYAAAATMSTRTFADDPLELLPGRPNRLDDNSKLELLLATIPSISTRLRTLESVYSIRQTYSLRAELLLSWVCNSYRGFLISATGPLRIPNMSGSQQFVLVDSPPEIAASFAKHARLQPRQVLFHGTSMDRLHAILCQGLKILSRTAFQTHGAVYGSGIYLADEPSTAVSYARSSRKTCSAFSANHSDYVGKKVLLGIEYAGNDAVKSNEIHVATDPSKLLLRYVFLLPEGFKAPIKGHVVPAMQSNFSTLSAGARISGRR